MGTPGSPIPGLIPSLYGDCATRINHPCATIHQDGKPWFMLMLDSFDVEIA
jgi:hypothetical protein